MSEKVLTSNPVNISRDRVQRLINMDAVPNYVVSALLDEVDRLRASGSPVHTCETRSYCDACDQDALRAEIARLRNDIAELTCGDPRRACPNCRGAVETSREPRLLDSSTAPLREKFRRFLAHLAGDKCSPYFHDDGFPRSGLSKDAAEFLRLLDSPTETTAPLPEGFTLYKRVGAILARPWTQQDAADYLNGIHTNVSVSEADKHTACSAQGMLAMNPDNSYDCWYIAPAYFAKHYANGSSEKAPCESSGKILKEPQ